MSDMTALSAQGPFVILLHTCFFCSAPCFYFPLHSLLFVLLPCPPYSISFSIFLSSHLHFLQLLITLLIRSAPCSSPVVPPPPPQLQLFGHFSDLSLVYFLFFHVCMWCTSQAEADLTVQLISLNQPACLGAPPPPASKMRLFYFTLNVVVCLPVVHTVTP